MLQKTPGLVLHSTPYGETSVIIKVFTRQLGLRSYIVKGARGARRHAKQSMLQPLSYLDMVVYDKPRGEINFIREMSTARQWSSLDSQPVKGALRFFASEALYKSLRTDEPSPSLFDYVTQQLSDLDSDRMPLASFPITFLLGLSQQLGIEPLDNYSNTLSRFNMAEGCFQSPSENDAQLSASQSALLHNYLSAGHRQETPPRAALPDRQKLLAALLSYYKQHLSSFGTFKSAEILHSVLE